MKKLLPILLLAPLSAMAQVDAIGVHLFSRHDPYRGENQYNPGMFVRFDNNISVGYYTNSLARQTNYIGITSPEWYRMKISLLAATGYKSKYPVIVPIPSVKLYESAGGVSFWLSGTPVQITDSRAVGHIHMEFKFK